MLNQPRWKYKVVDIQGYSFYKEESALARYVEKTSLIERNNSTSTDIFDNWESAFPNEEIIDPYDLPHSEYEVGSIVKVIDKDEHHSEWGVFEVIERKYNQSLYQSAETYLQQPQWYYRLSLTIRQVPSGLRQLRWRTAPAVEATANPLCGLSSNDDGSTISKSLWVAENEICHFDRSDLICTEDIF